MVYYVQEMAPSSLPFNDVFMKQQQTLLAHEPHKVLKHAVNLELEFSFEFEIKLKKILSIFPNKINSPACAYFCIRLCKFHTLIICNNANVWFSTLYFLAL